MTKYKDINENFVNATDTNANAISNSIKNLLLLKEYEMPGLPKMGTRLTGLLFEEPGVQVSELIKFEINSIIEYYEPRVKVSKIDLVFEDNKMLCSIIYKILDSFNSDENTLRLRLR